MKRERVELVKNHIETFLSLPRKKAAMPGLGRILGKIRGEEKSVLALTVRLTPLVTEALREINSALRLVAQARGHAISVMQLGKSRGSSVADAARIAETARREYFELKKALLLLRESVEGTNNAIRVMNSCINPLKAIEQYTKQLEKDLSQVRAPSGQRQIAFEESIFSLSKNVASGIKLNIQRCKAIKAQLTKFLARTNLPQYSAVSLSSVEKLSEELEQLQRWYIAAFNSIYHVNSVVNRVAELEKTAVLRQGLSMS